MYRYRFSLANRSACRGTSMQASVIGAAGVGIAPSNFDLLQRRCSPIRSATKQSLMISGSGATAGDTVRLALTLRDDQQQCSCIDTVTLALPECPLSTGPNCIAVSNERYRCTGAPTDHPVYIYRFNLANNAPFLGKAVC